MSEFLGTNRKNIILPRAQKMIFATAGFLFTDPNEAQLAGLRKPGKIGWKHMGVQEVAGKELLNFYQVDGEFDFLDTRLTTLKNFQLLSQDGFQLAIPFKTADSRDYWLNFFEDTTTDLTAPNGTCLIGCEPTYEMTDKDRSLKVKVQGKLYSTEETFMMTLVSGVATGIVTGNSSLGLVAMGMDVTTYKYPGIQSVIINGSNRQPGRINSPKLTMAFKKFDEDMRLLPICGEVEVSFEFTCMQAWKDEILAGNTAANRDQSVVLNTAGGETFTFTNCLSVQHDTEYGDPKSMVKIIMKGKIPYANITYTSTTMTCTLAGYA